MAEAFKDYYATLGVDSKATEQEIKAAYRKAARKYHPDLHTKGEKAAAEEKFKEVNEAYAALGNAEKRAQYDQLAEDIKNGRVRQSPPGRGGYSQYTGTNADGGYTRGAGGGTGAGADSFSDFFESIFGRSGFESPGEGPGRRAVARGQDLESELTLTMEEAYRGGGKTMQFTLRSNCETCGGTGVLDRGICPECHGAASRTTPKTLDVKIPPFVREGSKIRLKGQGGGGTGGGSQGDLLLTIRILPDARFTLSGNNLQTAVQISPEQAVLGSKVAVRTMEGNVTVTVPPMIHSGRKLRLKSKGWMGRDGVRGDLYILVTIDIPPALSAQQLELYTRLAGLGKEA